MTAAPHRNMVELSRTQALALITTIPVGRVVFQRLAMTRILPVTHVLHGRHLVLRTHGEPALDPAGQQQMVVFETDGIELTTRTGWSVNITGQAEAVTDPDHAALYQRLLAPLTLNGPGPLIRLTTDIVSGYRMAPDSANTA